MRLLEKLKLFCDLDSISVGSSSPQVKSEFGDLCWGPLQVLSMASIHMPFLVSEEIGAELERKVLETFISVRHSNDIQVYDV